jgi:hypothetical protein
VHCCRQARDSRWSRVGQANQAFKLTRLSACLLGGSAFGEDRAVPWSCTSSAARLSASVRRRVVCAA